MTPQRGYSLAELETIREAARLLLRRSPANTYEKGDIAVLSPAADLLETSIPALPQALESIGLSTSNSTATDTVTTSTSSDRNLSSRTAGRATSITDFDDFIWASDPTASVLPFPNNGKNVSGTSDPSPGAHTACATVGQIGDVQDALSGIQQQDLEALDFTAQGGDPMDRYLSGCSPDGRHMDPDPWSPVALHVGGSSSAHSAVDLTLNTPLFGHHSVLSLALDGGDAGTSRSPSGALAAELGIPGPRRQHHIAPKPTGYTAPALPTAATLRGKQRTARGPILDARVRKEISDTRQRGACIRCRMQKLKCVKHPQHPQGPCLACKSAANSIYRLPCLRYKIPDAPLFCHAMYNSSFYLKHPLIGNSYGDFYLRRSWVSSRTRTLGALHHGGLRLDLEVREFFPPVEEDATDDRSLDGAIARPMYAIPWAIADSDFETRSLRSSVDSWIEPYVENLLKLGDGLVWPVYREALRLMPTNDLMYDTMRLWVGARLADRGWRCSGDDTVGAETLENHLRPPDWVPLPPYLDYQLVSVIMHRYLSPLKKTVLGKLQKAVKANDPSKWYSIFLSCFVLLHSCEMMVVIIRKHAAKRKSPFRYIIMELVRALNHAAKIILAHFHYCCKGNAPFSKDFDWSCPTIKRMAGLDAEQSAFMHDYVQAVHEREDIFRALGDTDHYEAPYWFVCQLFERSWEPRVTLEHSPRIDDADISGKDCLVTENGTVVPLDPYLRPDIEEDVAKRPNRQPV